MSFIGDLPRVKVFCGRWKLPAILFFLTSIFWILFSFPREKITSNSALDFPISIEERSSLKKFFDDLLFEHMGAYVLYGTKPMSISSIRAPWTDEDFEQERKYYESLSEEARSKIAMKKRRYDYAENFRTWQTVKSRLNITQYLFALRPSPLASEGDELYFVNIEMAIRTLIEFYPDFRRVLGFDFDPLEVVFAIEDKTSVFWNEVMKNHALVGILLGFGSSNSWFFEYQSRHENDTTKIGAFLNSLHSDFSESRDIRYPDLHEFMLPIFGRYGRYPNDQQIMKQYRKEYAQIKGMYKNSDEVTLALSWLTRGQSKAL